MNSINDNEISSTCKSNANSKTYAKFGWGKIAPKSLQWLNKTKVFLILLCYIGFMEGFVCTGLNNSNISTLEKRFGLKASQVALLNTAFHVSSGLFVLGISYFGHRHRPKTIGISAFVLSIGVFIVTIPHYIIDSYIPNTLQKTDVCAKSLNATNFGCNENAGSSRVSYLPIFIFGYFIMGMGTSPIYSLSIAHIDETTSRGQNLMFTSVLFVSSSLGPALGFMAGKPILNIFVDLNQPEGAKILKPEDNNWVGAWWLGFLLGSILLLIPVIPMLGFPRLFPNAEILKENKKELEDTIEEDANLKHDLKSIWPATKTLLKNKPFIFICLAGASESLSVGGFATFLPKFVETQFYFTASNAAFATGLIIIPGVAGGMFFGGYMVKRFKWNCKTTIKYGAIFTFIATISVATVLIGCEGRDITGVTGSYPNSFVFSNSNDITLKTLCNTNCTCGLAYKPICSVDDQRTYYSPCYAGCSIELNKEYHNCSCFASNSTVAVEGRCTPTCELFPLFAVAAFLLFFFTFLNNVPMINATLRVVPEGQGSFAMGFQQLVVRFLGMIPAPTLFGSFIDKSCELWNTNECTGLTTSCSEYNNNHFRYYIFMLGVTTKVLSFVFICLAYKCYRLPVNRFSIRKAEMMTQVIANNNHVDSKPSLELSIY